MQATMNKEAITHTGKEIILFGEDRELGLGGNVEYLWIFSDI